ncbi:MAG: citrate transporter [Bacteroidetes bacterium]|jgi:hypothetical protein|nr:citrate transporter [Bacteroidota bacterium]
MLNAVLILLLFVAAATLMFLRKLPAVLALPLMAFGIGAVQVMSGRLDWAGVSAAILADGALRLADPMVISFFGGMVSQLLQRSGVAEQIVRRGAEFAGDNPLLVALVMLSIVTLLFTTIGGLGAVIMVGAVILPILLSLGMREHVAAGVLLVGISLGGLLNANNWAVYRSVLRLEDAQVSAYAVTLFGTTALVAVGFLAVELLRGGSVRFRTIRASLGGMLLVAVVIGGLAWAIDGSMLAWAWQPLRWSVAAVLAYAMLGSIWRYLRVRSKEPESHVSAWAYLTPVVPLVLILLFEVPFVAAFIAAFVYGIVLTLRRGTLNMVTRSVIEGSASVIPAVVLMLGIGMLLSAILGPTTTGPGRSWYVDAAAMGIQEWPVMSDMKPLLSLIVPSSGWTYVALFTLLGPLALYRGPLNVWGLGYGVGGILLATGVPAGAVMGILMSLGLIQGISDPTNTQNVWVANEVRIDVNEVMWRTLPYAWVAALLGLCIAGALFY